MSFDIFLQTSNLSDVTEKAKDPFTGKEYDKPVGETMTPEERSAVHELLAERGEEPDEFGFVALKANDGSRVVAHFKDLDGDSDCDGGSLELRSINPAVAEVIFEVADHGNLIMHVVADPLVILATSDKTKKKVESRWPEAEVADSAEALFKRIGEAFGQWSDYRDQVTDTDS
ncbi:MAG: hypothetical protein JJ916_09300 [Phycisphaerales bacterium]|nr:hypothetical protein [Phycisphaerales bacterium]